MQFVSAQQTGFVPGGFLPENIMLLKLIQAYVEHEDSDAWFVFLDMEKAFDRCSWEYLHAALKAIGFGEGFIKYIKLFYSHDNPPTRRICMNGHLGRAFPLASGVAQGCPLSPLLFLIITEALTRLIVNDPHINGIAINGVHHKISQFADDSTLMGRDQNDWDREEAHVTTWCSATDMNENDKKRAGQLVGKLNRQRYRAPTGIIVGDKWAADGDPIRALGIPMGNHLDLTAWWHTKYREIKQRIAAWRSIAHMSITGRSLLLQAVLYGSMRFWLFALVIPNSIIKLFEADAYHLLWATSPELLTNENGTSKKARAYIIAAASYSPQNKGGGGLMHLRSHIKAVYAHWGRRYLHPNNAPWKLVADTWLANPWPMGRGQMLTSMMGTTYTDIPSTAPYLRACIQAFEHKNLTQDTSRLDTCVQGESIFDSNRFDMQIDDAHSAAWSKFIGLKRIHHLIDEDTNKMFTAADMAGFTHDHAPTGIKDTPAEHEWSDALMSSWPTIANTVPTALMNAGQPQPQP
jgi:hypothetical protein